MKAKNDVLTDKQGWNDYWKSKKGSGGKLYDVIAEFYRKFIIRPNLNHFIKKYFKEGSEILHAGCGSGQVDRDIRDYVSITGLDISTNALEIYRRENGSKCKSLHGSIFEIPLPDHTLDGVYNLGVMEHFEEPEIEKILLEFKRVIKPGGKIIIFWPPEFGASVLFFKGLKRTLKIATGKDYKFHPDEVCRIKSRKHALQLFSKAGFNVLEYVFGARDAFTYSIVVAEPLKGR